MNRRLRHLERMLRAYGGGDVSGGDRLKRSSLFRCTRGYSDGFAAQGIYFPVELFFVRFCLQLAPRALLLKLGEPFESRGLGQLFWEQEIPRVAVGHLFYIVMLSDAPNVF